MTTLIIQGQSPDKYIVGKLADILTGKVSEMNDHFRITTNKNPDESLLAQLRQQYDVDINPIPEKFDPAKIRLFITDMDSTLINIECVDEIADFMGIKPEISTITESAMRGEIDFETSLTRRVKLLKGLDANALEHVYQERLQLNPGAEQLLAGLRHRDIKLALVSGGFTFFTRRLQQRLGLDYTLANELDIEDNKLTGKIRGNIVGAAAKAAFMLEICAQLGIDSRQVIAVGDGANDLKMMQYAGLSVAYQAKPLVQKQVDVVFNHSRLDSILAFLQ